MEGMLYSMFDTEQKFPLCSDCRIGGNLGYEGVYPNIKFKKYKCAEKRCVYYEQSKTTKERFQFACINPRWNKIKNNAEEINKIISWAENWFDTDKYSNWFWWVESGKNPENPSPHIHFIWKKGKHLNTKNHKRSLTASWNAIPFAGNKCWNPGEECYQVSPGDIVKPDDSYSEPFTAQYLDDKMIYAINSSKDSHENYMDLISCPHEGQRRAWGGCKSLTAKFRDLQSI